MGAFVYMLRCADGSYYIGSATGDDLSRRIAGHESGAYPGYTYTRRPVHLVWSEHFDRITDAIALERSSKAGAAPRRRRSSRATGISCSSLRGGAEASLGESLIRHPEVRAPSLGAPHSPWLEPSFSLTLRQAITTAVKLNTSPHPHRITINVVRKTGRATKAGMSNVCSAL